MSARKEAKDITDGKKKPHHIGPKSREMLLQEWYSLQNLKPAFRKPDHKWFIQQVEKELKDKYAIRNPMDAWQKVFKPKKQA